jgi:hypothetical protein
MPKEFDGQPLDDISKAVSRSLYGKEISTYGEFLQAAAESIFSELDAKSQILRELVNPENVVDGGASIQEPLIYAQGI